MAHCSTNLALLHGPAWGLRFAEAYEEAGGALAADASERLYWRVRDGLACPEEVRLVAQPWREAREDRADDASRAGAAGCLCHRPDRRAGLSQGGPARCPDLIVHRSTKWGIEQTPGIPTLVQRGDVRRGRAGTPAWLGEKLPAGGCGYPCWTTTFRNCRLSELVYPSKRS